jgi:hypothetical protein
MIGNFGRNLIDELVKDKAKMVGSAGFEPATYRV